MENQLHGKIGQYWVLSTQKIKKAAKFGCLFLFITIPAYALISAAKGGCYFFSEY